MTNLEYFTAMAAFWVAIAWAPYILNRIMVLGLMETLANPSDDAKPLAPWAQRAKRAHIVAIEAFAPFAAAALMAMIKIPDDAYAGTLAMSFFFGIFAHYIIYTMGIPVLRTLAFTLAALSTVALVLRVMGVI